MSQDCHPEFRAGKRGLKWLDKGMLYHLGADAPASVAHSLSSAPAWAADKAVQRPEHANIREPSLLMALIPPGLLCSCAPAELLCLQMNICGDCCHSAFERTPPLLTAWFSSNGAQVFLGSIFSSLRLGSSIFQQDCLQGRKGYMILVTTWRPLSQ